MKNAKLEDKLMKLTLKPDKSAYELGLMKQYTEEYIKQTSNISFISSLGSMLEDRGEYDTALYYYEEAYDNGRKHEAYFIGKIYYCGFSSYGIDYKKAFKYFKEASTTSIIGEGTFTDSYEDTHLRAKYMMMTMYRDGLGVKQNEKKYLNLLSELEDEAVSLGMGDYHFLYLDTISKIYRELAHIALQEDDMNEWFEDLNISVISLSELIEGNEEMCLKEDLEELTDILDEWYTYLNPRDPEEIDKMHCLYLLKEPAKLSFTYRKKTYFIESKLENDKLKIYFDGNQTFDNPIDMYMNAKIGKRFFSAVIKNTSEWLNHVKDESVLLS